MMHLVFDMALEFGRGDNLDGVPDNLLPPGAARFTYLLYGTGPDIWPLFVLLLSQSK